jgi:hypothetical protein
MNEPQGSVSLGLSSFFNCKYKQEKAYGSDPVGLSLISGMGYLYL